MIPTYLNFNGEAAIRVAQASHRMPELWVGSDTFTGGWKHAASMGQAIRLNGTDGSRVRVFAPMRVLMEDMLAIAIEPGQEAATLSDWLANPAISPALRAVLQIIQDAYTEAVAYAQAHA